ALRRYAYVLVLLFLIVSLCSFLFAATGGVYIASRAAYFGEGLDRKSNGIVSVMGPLVNVVAALMFLVALAGARFLGYPDPNVAGFRFLASGVSLNLWLSAYNMLPMFILDGQKVFAWDKKVWALLAIPLWIAAFWVPTLLR